MAINSILIDQLSDHVGEHAWDLSKADLVFHHLELAGIKPEEASPRVVLKCARFALRQQVDNGRLDRRSVADIYAQIHDAVIPEAIEQQVL